MGVISPDIEPFVMASFGITLALILLAGVSIRHVHKRIKG